MIEKKQFWSYFVSFFNFEMYKPCAVMPTMDQKKTIHSGINSKAVETFDKMDSKLR